MPCSQVLTLNYSYGVEWDIVYQGYSTERELNYTPVCVCVRARASVHVCARTQKEREQEKGWGGDIEPAHAQAANFLIGN